ncbi:MAG: transglutaminase family protein [Cypionkella sp.]|jgi:transglutaminase-like putative cysteine protease
MLLLVDHTTLYRYENPVRGVVQSHRLTPSVYDGQRVIDWQVTVSGGKEGGSFRDGAGDWVQSWSVPGPVAEIEVHVKGKVETQDLAGVLRGHKEVTPPLAYLRDTTATKADAALREIAAMVQPEDLLASCHALSREIAERIKYTPGTTVSRTTAAEALAQGEGVCQDQAHALIACARAGNVPARYVSGYLQSSDTGSTHEASHAWAELYIGGLGWIGFDPANLCCADDRYIRLGSGFDAQDAAPIRGISRGLGEESLEVTVAVLLQEQ